MKVGCVKEIKKLEFRVGMTPDNVTSYVAAGHEVWIEKDAGVGSSFTDEEYVKAGAKISSAKEIWATCEMIVKVKEPLGEELPQMRENQIVYTYLHLAAAEELTMAMVNQKVAGVAYETLQVGRALPLLKPMSEVAGRLSVQEGAKYLEKHYGGRGVLLGGVPGVERGHVVVIGAGVVGFNAAKMAVGLQARVTVIDIDIDRLSQIDDLYGNKITTLYSTDANIRRAVKDADLVVSAALIPGASAPKLIKKSYLKEMKPGAVIVDPAIDQGGTTEVSKVTYHDDPIFIVDDIVMYCVANMPGAAPRTATIALTNATLRYGLAIATNGLKGAYEKHPELVSAVNTLNGKVTYKAVADTFGIEYSPIK